MDYKVIVPERYRVTYDRKTGCFRILDCWHESIRNISDLNQEIPDDSPALKILSAMEVNALIGKLNELGWLDKVKMIKEDSTSIRESSKKDIKEIAIENIVKIVTDGKDSNISKEAVLAIREIVNKL